MTQPDVPKIELRGVSHWFQTRGDRGPVHALDDVDLEIAGDDFVVIVGPSGCGKSTLLRCVAGLEIPTSGVVRCDGVQVRGPGRERGVVFQDAALLPWRTVWRNIAHGLEIAKVPKAEREERVRALVDLVGLSGFERSYPHELSGGMRQRVGVARTWANDPDVILMDEPFAAVDAQTRLTLQQELVRITSDFRKATIFITHSVEEAIFLGDRVIVMSQRPGRIKEDVRIPVPRRERTVEALDTNPVFIEARAQILQSVRAEVLASAKSAAGTAA